MKLLSKISLVALMAIAPLTHAANQDAGSAIASLAADLNKIAREVGLGGEQSDKLMNERLNKLVQDIENGKIPKEAINNYITVHLEGFSKIHDTPLFKAVTMKDLNLVKRMIKLGANVDLPSKDDTDMVSLATPLIVAVISRNQSMVTELIKATKNINQTVGDNNLTALMMPLNGVSAAGPVSPAIIQQLVDAGADVRIKNKDGQTALDMARSLPKHYTKPQEKQDAEKVVKILEAAQAKK